MSKAVSTISTSTCSNDLTRVSTAEKLVCENVIAGFPDRAYCLADFSLGRETGRDVDLAALTRPSTTFVHDLASRLRCRKCAKAGKRPAATLLQLAQRPRQAAPET